MQESDMIVDAGYNKPICNLNINNKDELTTAVKMHYAMFRCKAELDQLISGLDML